MTEYQKFKSKMWDLLDELEDNTWNRKGTYVINHIRRKIDDLIETSFPQWIPTEFEQPVKDGWYLVTMTGDLWGEPYKTFPTMCEFKDGEWIEANEENISDLVLAWMGMPKPYQRTEEIKE